MVLGYFEGCICCLAEERAMKELFTTLAGRFSSCHRGFERGRSFCVQFFLSSRVIARLDEC